MTDFAPLSAASAPLQAGRQRSDVRARRKLVALAEALILVVDAGSPAARLLKLPRRRKTPPRRDDALSPGTQAQRNEALPALLASAGGGAVSVAQVNEVLAAGIRDITTPWSRAFPPTTCCA